MKLSWLYQKDLVTADMALKRSLLWWLIVEGAVVGIIAGTAGALFRYGILVSEHIRWQYMANITYGEVCAWLALMVVMGWVVDRLLRWAPLSSGSGIPQIEGEMMGLFDMKPFRIVVAKYLGGIFTGLAGFSVGREGPAVQLGGAVGKIVAYMFNGGQQEQRILISAGSAAGLTAAFSAPVSGAMFVFEEVHKSFYPLLVIPTFVATLIANYITVTIFGLEPSLGFTVVEGLPLHVYFYLVPVGIVMGVLGVAFCQSIFLFKRFYAWLPTGNLFKVILCFVVVALIGFDSQLLLGGGNELVKTLTHHDYGLWMLAGIVAGKILLTAFCYGSGAQGGIFLPMLVIGAASGALCESILYELGVISVHMIPQFVIAAMGGMLAAAMRTPILAILLVLEMTNSFSNIYAIGTVTIVAYLVAEFLKEPPIYESLLQAMAKSGSFEDVQTFFQTKIPVVSQHIGRSLDQIHLPPSTMIVSIRRNGTYIVPLGNVVLEPGDELQVSCVRGHLQEAKQFFMT